MPWYETLAEDIGIKFTSQAVSSEEFLKRPTDYYANICRREATCPSTLRKNSIRLLETWSYSGLSYSI